VRAYATNTKGAEYGDNIEFTTKNATYTVTLTVADNSVPLTGATITFGGVEHTSGSDGMVTIADVADGTYNYTVSKVGYIDATGQIIVDGGHVKETINLNLLSYNVTLTLVDGTSPIEGATITFGGVEHTSGSDGMLTIADVIDGTYNYTVTKTGYVEATGQIVVNGADVSETITLTLATYGVTLTVVRGDGTPIQDAILTFDGVEYLTATNGKVTITGVINGTYNYTVNMEDYDVATDNIVVDCANVAETIILSLLINNDITIKVVNSEATPIKGVTVGCNGVNNITGDNGVATFLDVANGTFTYTVRMEGYNDVTGQIVVDGADVDKTIILMPKTYSVTFTIVDAEGVPVDAVFIIFGGVEYHLNTGGIATITDAVNGTYDYTVTKGGYVNASGQIIVDDADVEETITLNTVNYSVSFTVVNTDAAPIEGATVTFDEIEYTTNTDGVVVFTDIPEGHSYTYTATKAGYTIETGSIYVNGVDVDKTITLSFTTGIDLNILNNLKVYPSLFSNEITITNADKVKRAIITNANGQCVMIISLTGSTQIINVSEINSGVYFLVFEGANGERIVRKLIKK
ncbi:MAG TPA: T9SS type A sorting domain-containing protein, partial [Prolixibacteraceae bacterium]|nr:T9SS type A sorting domain-containing protein [Prolixibacteraceae bacterium]